MSRFYVLSLLLVAACGAPATTTTEDPGPADTPDPSTTTSIAPAQCTPFAASMAAAASSCGTTLPAGAQTSFESWCKKGVGRAATCGGDPAAGLASFASMGANAWTCDLGDAYPTCGGDLGAALGAMCLVALGDPSCSSGIACNYDADCSGGMSCNSVTKECFTPNASCVGLPCQYDFDCPQGESCNGAEHACVGS